MEERYLAKLWFKMGFGWVSHEEVIKWKHFPHCWPFVRGIHRSPVNSPHKGQWRGALTFSLICAWTSGWINNQDAEDSRRHRAHYGVTVMLSCNGPQIWAFVRLILHIFRINNSHLRHFPWLIMHSAPSHTVDETCHQTCKPMPSYTLGKKGFYTPIEDNKTNVDRTFVFPLGWNWHNMDPWLFPNEIRHYLGQTFNARSSGIVELRNHSIGGRSPKSIFTLWQLWINICIFFQKFFWLFEQCPVQPLWVLGMRCLHLPVRALSKVLLLPVWVWLVLPSTAYSKSMLPLDLWCQASLQGLPERQHLGKTVHCWGWSDRIVSWVLGPWRRGWEICTEWGLVAQRLTTDSCPWLPGI